MGFSFSQLSTCIFLTCLTILEGFHQIVFFFLNDYSIPGPVWKQDGNMNQNNLSKGRFSNPIKSLQYVPNSDPVTSLTGNTLRRTYENTHHSLVSHDTWKPPKFPQTVYILDRGIMEPINMMEKQTASCVEYIHAPCWERKNGLSGIQIRVYKDICSLLIKCTQMLAVISGWQVYTAGSVLYVHVPDSALLPQRIFPLFGPGDQVKNIFQNLLHLQV